MSFGWSAGDIVAAISLAHNLYKAFDDCTGVSGEYRETVLFLKSLIRTLEPLMTFMDWTAHPTYANEIQELVVLLKTPINDFNQDVAKFETSLGCQAKKGRHRNVGRKLQWYCGISKKVSSLKSKIEMHMRVLDTLLQRLTLDILLETQQRLPHILRTVIQDTIRQEVVTISESSAHHQGLSPELGKNILHHLQELKTDIIAQARASSCIVGCGRQLAIDCPHTSSLENRRRDEANNQLGLMNHGTSVTGHGSSGETRIPGEETIQEVFYQVLLFLGRFLKSLFMRLAHAIQPSRQLTPILLAKYNISFLDAMGSPVRVLPYEYFRSFKVFQAFVMEGFKGVAAIEKQLYSLHDIMGRCWRDDEDSWRNIRPGSIIAMRIRLVTQKPDLSDDVLSLKEPCPNRACLSRGILLEERGKDLLVWYV